MSPVLAFLERLQFVVLNSGQSRFARLPLLADCPSRHAALPSPRLAGSQRLIGFPYSLLRRGWDLGQKSAFRLDLWCLTRGLMLGQRHPAGPLQPCFVLGELSTSCPSHRGGEQSLVEPWGSGIGPGEPSSACWSLPCSWALWEASRHGSDTF